MRRARVNKQKGGQVLKEPVQVFCRVRPHPAPSAATNETAFLRIVPPSNIHLLPPTSTNRNVPSKELQYTFKHVFDESASQKELFEEVGLPLIKNLLLGRNSLLLTYGVTGSGKTYTMTGTLQDGGIMPRCFDAIFDSISEYQAKRNTFKPDKLNGFEIISDGDADIEGVLQARIAVAKINKLEKKNSDPDIAQRVRDQSYSLPLDSDNCYAVFITYIEIYNNNVYDLLEDIYEENVRMRPLNTKIVREDSNHNMFVHGVNEVEVSSTDEAFEAYFYGQKRRRIAQTALNAESSRSHSVFSIRLVQAPANESGNGVDPQRNYVTVSQLSLVDLAGSERTNRTKNTGMRLKEAGNINNSLLTLRICLELLRENQNGANKVIPYRDSRLTHLFRNYFDGDGQVSMIICVSPLVEEVEETMQVLKFAEMSQEIVTSVQTPLKPTGFTPRRKRIYEDYDLAVKEFKEDKRAKGDFMSQSLPDLLENIPDVRVVDFTNKEKIAKLKIELQNLKAHSANIKNWDFTSLRNKIVKFERDTYVAVNQAKAQEQQCRFERERVSTLENRLQLSDREQMKLKRKLEEAESTVKKLKGDLAAKDVLIKRKNMEQEKVKEEFSHKMVQAQEKLNREIERKLKTQKAAWESEMKHQEGRIRMARQVLSSEAKVDLPSYATPSRSRVPPSRSVESIPGSLKGVSVASVKSSLFNGGAPYVSAVTNAPNPQFSNVGNTPRPTARKGVPVVNRRYRRSRSVENDVWLEHRPLHEVPSNTVMQPVMARRKSVTKLTDSKDVTEKANKYCLLTQNQDSDGDLETRLYKGDVIPTAGGGAQVTFNDVEVLKQVSPSGSPSRKTPKQIRQDLEAACAQTSESHRFPQPSRSHTQVRRPQD